jgi:hypothetical protein
MVRHTLLLFLASLFSFSSGWTSAEEEGAISKSTDLIYQRNITIGGNSIGLLEVFQDEEPADAVFHFATRHALDQSARKLIFDEVCLQLTCGRTHAIVLSMPVMGNEGSDLGTLEIPEGSEPADVIQAFTIEHNLGVADRDYLIQKVCGTISCARLKPLVWKKEIVIDGNSSVTIEIEEGQEPADEIFIALKPFNLAYSQRKIVMEEVKKNNVPHTREYAFVFDQGVVVDNATTHRFQLLDDGTEPIDALYRFASYYKLEEYWDNLVATLLPKACAQIPCQRQIPVIWSRDINREDGTVLGVVEVFKGQEPIDAIDAFCQFFNISKDFREEILKVACQELVCLRSIPVVYRKPVNNEGGEPLGAVEVLENEEVTDAVTRFLSKTTLSLEEPRLRDYFFQDACTNPRVKCDKKYNVEWDNRLVDENGKELGRLHAV